MSDSLIHHPIVTIIVVVVDVVALDDALAFVNDDFQVAGEGGVLAQRHQVATIAGHCWSNSSQARRFLHAPFLCTNDTWQVGVHGCSLITVT